LDGDLAHEAELARDLALEHLRHPALTEPARDAVPWRHVGTSVARWIACLVGVAACTACAATPKSAIPIAIVIDGDRGARGGTPRVAGLDPREVALPAPPTQVADATGPAIARARVAYQHGDLDACRGELARVDIAAVLARGDRATAARALA